MKIKDYVSSQLVEQGTLLKKFNKLIELFEEFKAIKVYRITLDFSGYALVLVINSMTEIKTFNDVLNCMVAKTVRGSFENYAIADLKIENDDLTIYYNDTSYVNDISELSLNSIEYLGDL